MNKELNRAIAEIFHDQAERIATATADWSIDRGAVQAALRPHFDALQQSSDALEAARLRREGKAL